MNITIICLHYILGFWYLINCYVHYKITINLMNLTIKNMVYNACRIGNEISNKCLYYYKGCTQYIVLNYLK